MKLFHVLALGSVLSAGLIFAQAPAPAKSSTPAHAAKTANPAPSAADIADAKSKGLVWVNLNTKVYHYSADSHYGNTKSGKFMSEADAKAGGYRAAKQGAVKPKAATTK